MRGSGCRLWAAAALACLMPLTANAAPPVQGVADLIYECANSLEWAEQNADTRHPVTSDMVWANYDSYKRVNAVSEAASKAELDLYWDEILSDEGPEALREMIVFTAGVCAQDYSELLEQGPLATGAAPSFGADAEPARYSAAQLQDYVDQTGDYASVADYIVHDMPDGKDPFGQSAEGEMLGRMVVDAGAKGVIRFSDDAILAMVGARYWQYNPPASRIVEDEYRRRLSVRNYSAAQGKSWTERAARDRAEQARLARAKPVGSIGRHCEKYMEPAGPGTPAAWVTKCATR